MIFLMMSKIKEVKHSDKKKVSTKINIKRHNCALPLELVHNKFTINSKWQCTRFKVTLRNGIFKKKDVVHAIHLQTEIANIQ